MLVPACYLHQVIAPILGVRHDNETLRLTYESDIAALPLDSDARARLAQFVRFQLIGERARRSVVPDWSLLGDFASRADLYEAGAEQALDLLAAEIGPSARNAGFVYDALVTTTSTGGLMPGLSYRLAHRLGDRVAPGAALVDLAHAGCTGSLKALQVARHLLPSFPRVLLAAVELPTVMLDSASADHDVWQGNCTFGDGCVAVHLSTNVNDSPAPLLLEQLQGRTFTADTLDLIHWQHRTYYTFRLRDESTFDGAVRQCVVETLNEFATEWRQTPRWVVHPAGIALLVRLSRKLGISSEALRSTVAHYREYSNQSSVSLYQILAAEREATPVGQAINLLSMGAGFEVYYGRVRRCAPEIPAP